MNDNVAFHPHRELMAEAKHEREVVDSPEGQALMFSICKAVQAYSDFLEAQNVIWQDGVDPDNPDWPLRERTPAFTVENAKQPT